MKLGAMETAILNTSAFAPVPFMLFLYHKLMQKKGIRFAYQMCLLAFAIAILNFCIGSEYVFPGEANATVRLIIGAAGGTFSSFAIGAFFSMPYIIPSQIAAMEFKVTGKDHSAMYFAVQALVTSVVGAVSSGLVYENIKNITATKIIDGVEVVGETWKVGVSIVPVLVSIACVVGFLTCFRMPKEYNEDVVRASLNVGKEDSV
jgi:MFS family permease